MYVAAHCVDRVLPVECKRFSARPPLRTSREVAKWLKGCRKFLFFRSFPNTNTLKVSLLTEKKNSPSCTITHTILCLPLGLIWIGSGNSAAKSSTPLSFLKHTDKAGRDFKLSYTYRTAHPAIPHLLGVASWTPTPSAPRCEETILRSSDGPQGWSDGVMAPENKTVSCCLSSQTEEKKSAQCPEPRRRSDCRTLTVCKKRK